MKTYSKRTVVNVNDPRNTELSDRLNHYNDWLLDDKRDIPSIYPGYPGDKTKKPTTTKVEKPTVAPVKPVKRKKGKSVMSIETVGVKVAKIARGPKAGTKQAKAIEIVRVLGVSAKTESIEKIMADLGMSKAGATTYFHNARHFLSAEAAQ